MLNYLRKDPIITGYKMKENGIEVEVTSPNGKKNYFFVDDKKIKEEDIKSKIEDNIDNYLNSEEIIDNNKKILDNIKARKTENKVLLIISIIMGCSLLLCLKLNIIPSYLLTNLAMILSGTLSLGLIVTNLKEIIKEKKLINDYKKYKFFFDNKEMLQDIVNKKDILANLSEKTQNIINENNGLDYSIIDKIDFAELKKICSLTKMKEEISFEKEKTLLHEDNKDNEDEDLEDINKIKKEIEREFRICPVADYQLEDREEYIEDIYKPFTRTYKNKK